MNGASENEINEAIAVAAGSRHWSTFINGIQYDEEEFQNETDKVVAFTKNQMTKPAESSISESSTKEEVKPIVVIDSQTAYQDIEKTLGSVPGFFKQFPEASVASAWKMMKTVELNPETELSAKTKELISMSVAAQTPCPNCTYLHTELAKVNGASTAEVKEALAMASVTRFWSTVLNGSQTDFKTFKREADQMMNFMKKQESKKVGMTAITQNSVSR
jgi:AhpD family alkylhydroperoxidase